MRVISEGFEQIRREIAVLRRLAIYAGEDIFLSFLYAAAVHIAILHLLQKEKAAHLTLLGLLLVLGIIVFFGFDWLSRSRIRDQLPEEFPLWSLLSKLTLDIGAVYCLVISCAIVIEAMPTHDATSSVPYHLTDLRVLRYTAGAYAVFAFLWNLLILKVMKKLKWCDIVRGVASGTVMSLPGVSEYAGGRLFEWAMEANKRRDRAWEKVKPEKDWTGWRMICVSIAASTKTIANELLVAVRRGIFRTLGELAGMHVSLSHVLVAMRLIGGPLLPSVVATLGGSDNSPCFLSGVLLTVMLVVMSVLFSFGRDQAGGVGVCLYSIWLFFLTPLEMMLLIHVTQQTCVSLVLQFAIRPAGPNNKHPESCAG